ncbi:MAG: sel1 repeat family protein [Methylophilaceae bacterium]|nr:MAG: sel1 repeat family protein [Methylophilaceae bacterium]
MSINVYAADSTDDGENAVLDGDYARAAKIFKPHALKGDAFAQYMLGTLYIFGQGVTQDYAEAVKLFMLAAQQGLAQAQHMLGDMYYFGRGVTQDYTLAHMWYNLSGAQGTKLSIANRDLVAKKLTPQQLTEAQKLARECVAKNYKGCGS